MAFFTDAKAEDGRAWVGGLIVPGCQGPWFSLEVDRSWAPWAFSKSSPNKVIAALDQSNEALVKKAMTTKYPSSLILLELAEELAAKKCDLNLIWIRRDWNQLAGDLTNEKFDSFDPEFRVPVKGDEIEWRVLDKLLNCADSFYGELKKRKAAPIGPVRKAGKIRKLSPW